MCIEIIFSLFMVNTKYSSVRYQVLDRLTMFLTLGKAFLGFGDEMKVEDKQKCLLLTRAVARRTQI